MPDKNLTRRVLVLEDEPIISRIILRILKAAGLEVDIAGNGLVAKEKINTGVVYDLYIFDIKTPIISGMQLYEDIKATHPELTKKITFISGDYLSGATCEFLERVKRPFLAKPFTPDQLMKLVKQVLQPELTTV
jgi:DNA-binding NtrC family response regulator